MSNLRHLPISTEGWKEIYKFEVLWLEWECDPYGWVVEDTNGVRHLVMTNHGTTFEASPTILEDRIAVYERTVTDTKKALVLLREEGIQNEFAPTGCGNSTLVEVEFYRRHPEFFEVVKTEVKRLGIHRKEMFLEEIVEDSEYLGVTYYPHDIDWNFVVLWNIKKNCIEESYYADNGN